MKRKLIGLLFVPFLYAMQPNDDLKAKFVKKVGQERVGQALAVHTAGGIAVVKDKGTCRLVSISEVWNIPGAKADGTRVAKEIIQIIGYDDNGSEFKRIVSSGNLFEYLENESSS